MSGTTVLVLGGGPDAERAVSIDSSAAVAEALLAGGRFDVVHEIVDKPSAGLLAGLAGEVVFPVLHGRWGEGGPMQDLLEADGRPYVGCRPGAARLAMDKLATKLLGLEAGVPTARAAVLDPMDRRCPLELPVVVKPVLEGSSVGLFICRDERAWQRAHAGASADMADRPGRVYMVEACLDGRELTVGVLGPRGRLRPLPVVEIRARGGVYDYAAKYERDDTEYTTGPDLTDGMGDRLGVLAVRAAERLGVRHLARVDFLLTDGEPRLLEVNTMPGFTSHSLFPMAAGADGLEMPELCARLVELALDGATIEG